MQGRTRLWSRQKSVPMSKDTIPRQSEGRLTIEDGVRSGEPLPGRYPLWASGLSEFTFGALLRGNVVVPYADLNS